MVKEKGADLYLYESYVRCLNCGGRFFFPSVERRNKLSFGGPNQAVH